MTSLSLFISQALYSHGRWTATYCTKFSSGFTCWLLRLEGRCPVWLYQLPAPGSEWHASHTPWFIPQVTAAAPHPVETGHTNSRKSLRTSQQDQKFRGDFHPLPTNLYSLCCTYINKLQPREPCGSYLQLPRDGPKFFHLPKLWPRDSGHRMPPRVSFINISKAIYGAEKDVFFRESWL